MTIEEEVANAVRSGALSLDAGIVLAAGIGALRDSYSGAYGPSAKEQVNLDFGTFVRDLLNKEVTNA